MVTEEIFRKNAERAKKIDLVIHDRGPYFHEIIHEMERTAASPEERALSREIGKALEEEKIGGRRKFVDLIAIENRSEEPGATHIIVGNIKVDRGRGIEHFYGSAHESGLEKVGFPVTIVRMPLTKEFWEKTDKLVQEIRKERGKEVDNLVAAKYAIEQALRQLGHEIEVTVGTGTRPVKTSEGYKNVPYVSVSAKLPGNDPKKAVIMAKLIEEALKKLVEEGQ